MFISALLYLVSQLLPFYPTRKAHRNHAVRFSAVSCYDSNVYDMCINFTPRPINPEMYITWETDNVAGPMRITQF